MLKVTARPIQHATRYLQGDEFCQVAEIQLVTDYWIKQPPILTLYFVLSAF